MLSYYSKYYSHISSKISDIFSYGGNFVAELCNLVVLPKPVNGLHGFSLDELNHHCASMTYSPTVSVEMSLSIVKSAPADGLSLGIK